MPELLFVCVAGLMLSLLLGLIRVLRGPEAGDRMMAAQLIGTTGVGILLLLSLLLNQPALARCRPDSGAAGGSCCSCVQRSTAGGQQ